MKKYLLILLSAVPLSLFPQEKNSSKEYQEKINRLEVLAQNVKQQNEKLKKENTSLLIKVNALNKKSDSIYSVVNANKQEVSQIKSSLSDNINNTRKDIDSIGNNISQKTVYGIVTLFFVFTALIISYLFLRKRIVNSSSVISKMEDAQAKLQNAQKEIQEESVKLDSKLVELLDKQLNVQNLQAESGNSSAKTFDEDTLDHSLALKVADEITRIEVNLSRMDPAIRGYKQLSKSVERIKDNFLSNGYEMVAMLGKPYNDGMKLVASFVLDENLKEGQQIITGIIKPQINYKGIMIQSAQITVSQNI